MKGAFTGAVNDKTGYFVAAREGRFSSMKSESELRCAGTVATGLGRT